MTVALPALPLSLVLAEIETAQREFNESYGYDLPAELDRLEHLEALQDEARAMIEAATGVSMTAILAASL